MNYKASFFEAFLSARAVEPKPPIKAKDTNIYVENFMKINESKKTVWPRALKGSSKAKLKHYQNINRPDLSPS